MFVAAAVGIALGLAVTIGPLVAFDVRVAALGDGMVTGFAQLTTALLERTPWVNESPRVVSTFSTIVAVVAPGVVAMGLVAAARQVATLRRAMAVVLAAAAAASFFALPAAQAALLVTGAVVCAAALVVPAGFVARVALWALAAAIAADNVVTIADGSNERVRDGTEAFAAITGLDAPEFWKVATVALALAPFACVLFADRGDS